jgi:hypothetical protein
MLIYPTATILTVMGTVGIFLQKIIRKRNRQAECLPEMPGTELAVGNNG